MLGRFAKIPPDVETSDVVNELVVRPINTLRQKTFDSPIQFLRYSSPTIRSKLIDLARDVANRLLTWNARDEFLPAREQSAVQ